MPEIILVLGQVAFSDFEVPEHISFGGRQRLAVHELPGGLRIVDALGRSDGEVSWSGVFAGENATSRARLLDLMRVQGMAIPLTWDALFYSVVISAFEAQYRKNWWVPYRISCTVLRDDAVPIAPSVVSLAVQMSSDIGSALALAANAGINLAPAQFAVTAANATAPGTAASSAAQAALLQSQEQIGSAISAADQQLTALGTGTLAATSPAAAGAAAIADATAGLGQLSYLTTANGYIGRSLANLGAGQS